MTREEEASKTLTQYIDYDAETPDYYEMEKACKVAIKVLEQIPDLKEAYNKGYKDGQEAVAFHYELCKKEGSIIIVPDGATNGDMIKAMFPQFEVFVMGDNQQVTVLCGEVRMDIGKEWWNSPYRKEQE